MSEVVSAVVRAAIDAYERVSGASGDALLAEAGVARELVRGRVPRGRVPWEAFARFVALVEAALPDPDDFAAVSGGAMINSDLGRWIARLVLTPFDFVRIGCTFLTPRAYRAARGDLAWESEDTALMRCLILPEHVACPALLRSSAAGVRLAPQNLGLPPARVAVLELGPRASVFRIRFAGPRASRSAWLGRWTSRGAAREAPIRPGSAWSATATPSAPPGWLASDLAPRAEAALAGSTELAGLARALERFLATACALDAVGVDARPFAGGPFVPLAGAPPTRERAGELAWPVTVGGLVVARVRVADTERAWHALTLLDEPIARHLRRAYAASRAAGHDLGGPLANAAADAGEAAATHAERAGLTPRQREVLDLLLAGATNAEIGAALACSPKTVSLHVTEILRKSGVDSRTRLQALVKGR